MKRNEVEELVKDYLSGYLKVKKSVTDNEVVKFQYEVVDLFFNNLKKVDEVNHKILILYYYNKLSWSFIERKVSLSMSQCQRRRDKMLNELGRMLS